jgi:glycosyltransferase involved in cell wall biosynthesis
MRLRICVIGKYPPIQGGVSMRTFWTAHGLAGLGHEVHVVTNAKEVQPPFRMHMRPQDWDRCEASYGAGSVTVHWTDPVDRSQSYIPMASPFVSKLASVAANVHRASPFDVIFSHYLEPYGVAGYLASQMTGLPHVVRMAGSDAGRLWHHPQFEALYDHVMRSAEVVVAAHVVADRAIGRGVDASRIAGGGGYTLPDLFAPIGPVLDLAALRIEIELEGAGLRDALWGQVAADQPYFGIYGKLGENKGSFALLAAMQRLKRAGTNVGLVALAHGRTEVEIRFRERVQEFGLMDRVLQIPFLPHWRVPEFLRGCLAVCCLEQNFPIGFHSPITPLEALQCGACLVGSTEVIRKLPQCERLAHGYGCVAIEDVNNIDELTEKLGAIVRNPELVAVVGARGHQFASEVSAAGEFPRRLEFILCAASKRLGATILSSAPSERLEPEATRFPLTTMVAAAIAEVAPGFAADAATAKADVDLAMAQALLVRLRRAIAEGNPSLRPLAQAVEVEVGIAVAEGEGGDGGHHDSAAPDPLFRLNSRHWALGEGEVSVLVPMKDSRLSILRFEFDVAEFRGVTSFADLPRVTNIGPSYLVACMGAGREPVLVDELTARFLELSDGTKTVGEISQQLERKDSSSIGHDHHIPWAENLFRLGFISLRPAEQDRQNFHQM